MKKRFQNYYRLVIMVTIIQLLSSCTMLDMVFHPSTYKKKSYTDEKIIIYDTIIVSIDNEGRIQKEAIAGFRPKKEKKFEEIGDVVEINKDEPLRFISNGVDFNRSAISVSSEEGSKKAKIKIVDKFYDEIFFEKQCQCFEVYNVNELPPIRLNPELDIHQIIITPIVNNSRECELLGYQIRYGDQKLGGCWGEAGKIYTNFKTCVGGTQKSSSIPKSITDIIFGR